MSNRPSDEKKGPIGLFVIAFLLGVAYVVWLASGASSDEPEATATASAIPAAIGPTRTLRPTRMPDATAPPQPSRPSGNGTAPQTRVGVVAGHWQNDSGAVCPDGLQEVDINLDVASRVVALLQQKGYSAELLPEFSRRLNGYQADAFVSIHVDSCEAPGLSGFKVARVASSAIPQQEDRLVACLSQEYARGTGLTFHENTITFDMTDYHAFREIDSQTPGAIIELGFMDADREILTVRSSTVAEAVMQGVLCFLEGE